MQVMVLSRKEAVKLKYKQPDGVKSAMVSISSVGERYSSMPRPAGDVKHILYLNFDDVTNDEDGYPMTEKDAEKLAQFVDLCFNNSTQRLYVHCDAGLSRSAAVAKALQTYYGLLDNEVSYKKGSHPNKLVYQCVMNVLVHRKENNHAK